MVFRWLNHVRFCCLCVHVYHYMIYIYIYTPPSGSVDTLSTRSCRPLLSVLFVERKSCDTGSSSSRSFSSPTDSWPWSLKKAQRTSWSRLLLFESGTLVLGVSAARGAVGFSGSLVTAATLPRGSAGCSSFAVLVPHGRLVSHGRLRRHSFIFQELASLGPVAFEPGRYVF